MDNLPRQTTDGKLINPTMWYQIKRDGTEETDAARDEMYRALELAERIIANLPSEEMLTNRIAEAMAYGARCEHEQLKRESWKMRVLLPIQQRDVIAEREALKKAERAAQPKTEWLEELDYA